MGHLVRAEDVGLSQRGQYGKERLGAPHLVAEALEGMRERVTNRAAQGPQAKRVEEDAHLAADA